MTTYINTNTTASNAALNLNANSGRLSMDIQQLSTGLKINSAADNPAGLVIDENMKAQLSGLSQATSNSNDAINMTKTAESALNQVQNLLISMRQLAVQASNTGANDSTATQADQTQIASMIQSINRISATTQFGNKTLLNGSSTAAMTTTNGSAAASQGSQFSVVAKGSWSTGDAFNYTSNTLSANSAASMTFGTAKYADNTTVLSSSNTTFNGTIAINGTTYNLASSSTNSLSQLNTAIASSGYQAKFNSNGSLEFDAQSNGPTTQPVVDLSNLAISGGTTSIAATGTAASNVVTFATAAGTGGALPVSLAAVSSSTKIGVSGTLALTDSTSGTAFSKTYTPGTSINQVQTDLNSVFGTGANKVTVSTDGSGNLLFTGKSGDTIIDGGSSFKAFNTVASPTSGTFVNGANAALTLSDGAGHTLTSTTTQQVGSAFYYSFQNGLVLSSSVAASTTGTTNVNGSLQGTAGTTTAGNDLQFQIGANGGQTASLSIGSTAADQIGKGAANYNDANGNAQTVLTGSVSDINVTTFKGAQDAMAVIDKAINDISTVRSSLGSFQSNVLQSNVTSLGISSTNLQASEATVADADMASTIVDYTKNQILVSASTSALAYANQMPQSILKLLQ